MSRDLNEDFVFLNDLKRIRTHRVPFGIDFFHQNGFFSSLTASFVNQDVRFPRAAAGGTDHASDSFWLMDAGIGYRLPKRRGIASLSVKNLLDKNFDYQDTDVAGTPRLPPFQPDRSVFVNLSLSL
jgi:outer membrane receptor protein involved in Fe transport